jgi:hypothetical protein
MLPVDGYARKQGRAAKCRHNGGISGSAGSPLQFAAHPGKCDASAAAPERKPSAHNSDYLQNIFTLDTSP